MAALREFQDVQLIHEAEIMPHCFFAPQVLPMDAPRSADERAFLCDECWVVTQ